MFGVAGCALVNDTAILYLKENITVILIACVCGYPIVNKLNLIRIPKQVVEAGKFIGLAAVFIFSLSFIIKGAYNPFIYFNF